MNTSIFVDFDGTITKQDTCSAMVKLFAIGAWEELNRLWEDKKLSTAECARQTFQLMKATPADLRQLLDGIEIDEDFPDFLAFCRERGYQVTVVSDGYDFNIKAIFARYKIEVDYYANKLSYDVKKGFAIESPFEDSSCRDCGTCKTALIKRLSSSGDRIVYIGDGHSDKCPVQAADVVFAKGFLYKYCLENGIKVSPFRTFRDIKQTMQELPNARWRN